MTSPALASKGAYGMRHYRWPPHPPHEFEVVSVTSVVSNGLPKPFLKTWGEGMVAKYAVEHVDDWHALSKKDPVGVVDTLKRSVYRSTSEKADMGTIVHSAVESYVAGKPLSNEQLEEMLTEKGVSKSKWKSTRGYIAGAMEFLMDHEPEVLHSEATLFSRTHGYAGTSDLVCLMRIGGSIKPVIVDFKTSKSIYDDVGLQLCAYAKADFVGLNDGTEAPVHSAPINDGVVVRLMPSGRYELAAFTLTDELFQVFLACKAVALSKDTIRQSRRPGF